MSVSFTFHTNISKRKAKASAGRGKYAIVRAHVTLEGKVNMLIHVGFDITTEKGSYVLIMPEAEPPKREN